MTCYICQSHFLNPARPGNEPFHPILERLFPTIKGPSEGKSSLHLENLTLDVYTQLFGLWKSAAHASLARRNSPDISPDVKQGDRNVLKRRTCEGHINMSSMRPIIQIRFKFRSCGDLWSAIWRSGSHLT